jgi:two-component system sensor histidine kinase DegS
MKHAKATNVMIKLEIGKQNIVAVVADNGIGFEAEQFLQEPKANNYGILGMKERVEILGGQFSMKSGQGKGTEVMAILPFD